MLRFFRRIRQNLLNQSSLRKYLAYALGEILLIVVGILIAFQVNNYSELRKSNKTEAKTLENLILCLQDDLKTISFNIDKHNRSIISGEILLDIFNKSIPYQDSLLLHFAVICYYTNFMSNLGAYESLKGKGVDLISNDELRFDIINLYEKWYPIVRYNDDKLTDDILHLKRFFFQDHFDKFEIFHLNKFAYAGEMIPNNFNKLKNTEQYQYFIKSLISSHRSVIMAYELVQSKAQSILDQSMVEIQELND